ncbi:hypothetical protein ACLKA7_000783 [Drosophila subpalustris]
MPPLSPADTGPTPDGQCPAFDSLQRPQFRTNSATWTAIFGQKYCFRKACFGYAAMCRCVLLSSPVHNLLTMIRLNIAPPSTFKSDWNSFVWNPKTSLGSNSAPWRSAPILR